MITHVFRNLNFRKKIFVICLIVSMVPVAFLGCFSYFQMKSILITREKTALSETLLQESNLLNAKLDSYEQALQHIVWNNNIILALRQEYGGNMEMYQFYNNTLDPLFSATKALTPSIKSITLYTNAQINPHGQTLRPLEELETFSWYEAVCDDFRSHWIYSAEEETLYLVGQIYSLPKTIQAFVRIEIDYSDTFQSMNTLYESSYAIQLTDQQGVTIYQFHTEDMKYVDWDRAREHGNVDNPKKVTYIVETISNICDEWVICLCRPTKSVLSSVDSILLVVLLLIIVCLVSVVLASSLLASTIVRPLEKLAANMKQVERGSIVCTVACESKDEIGNLAVSFTKMVARLNDLIEELAREKVLQKDYELRALQAQVNPHFLYNSLSLINSKAIITGQTEIAQMAQFLSVFYRTTLNRGESLTTVKSELENIDSYIHIQLLMHSNSFDVEYKVSEDILHLRVLNLILQPLVENAIFHGIDCIEENYRGRICLEGKLQEGNVIFTISDNGPGIPACRIEKIFSDDVGGGYGALNVHQRIQLVYGDAYGLSYKSQEGHGTTAVLKLPAQL